MSQGCFKNMWTEETEFSKFQDWITHFIAYCNKHCKKKTTAKTNTQSNTVTFYPIFFFFDIKTKCSWSNTFHSVTLEWQPHKNFYLSRIHHINTNLHHNKIFTDKCSCEFGAFLSVSPFTGLHSVALNFKWRRSKSPITSYRGRQKRGFITCTSDALRPG